jgi:hypothetical protein
MTYEEFKVWNDRKIATCHDEGNDHGVEVCIAIDALVRKGKIVAYRDLIRVRSPLT